MSVNKFKPPTDTLSNTSDSAPSTPIRKLSRSSSLDRVSTIPKNTTLYNGETVSKYEKILSVLGSIEEFSAYIGIIKAEHLNPNFEEKFDIDSSAKLFIYARLTQIQESLIDIQASIGTSKKNMARYEFTRFSNGEQRIKELDREIELMNGVNISQIKENMKEKPLQNIPGTSVLEARLMYARSLCRRVERQLYTSKNLELGIFPDNNSINYLNKLGDYLLALSIHTLHMQRKEPLKKTQHKKFST